MTLTINKLAKVDNASLAFNGITIVAGANNTGKSTVGKALWAMFNAFSNLDARISSARRDKYRFLLQECDERYFDYKFPVDQEELASDLESKKISLLELESIFSDALKLCNEKPDIQDLVERFKEVSDLTDEEIKCQEVLNVVAGVFHSQCGSFLFPDSHPYFELEIRGRKLSLEVLSAHPRCSFDVKLQHQAFYIDSPDSLLDVRDATRRRWFHFRMLTNGSRLSESLVAGVREKMQSRGKTATASVDDLLLRKKFSKIEKQLTDLMGGTLSFTKDQGLVFIDRLFPNKPLKVDNLSQGVKSMALLQAAFMNGTISDSDVLILDEPEIHLHPRWQVRYAEFIVLLQKEFGLTVLLTSHSPDFVEAIRLYSQKHGIKGHLNGYLSKVADNGSVTLNEIPEDNWDDVFDSFGSSFDELMKLRADLEGEHGPDTLERA